MNYGNPFPSVGAPSVSEVSQPSQSGIQALREICGLPQKMRSTWMPLGFVLVLFVALSIPGVAQLAISGVTATNLTPTSATITWSTDQPATAQVNYGTTEAYGALSPGTTALATNQAVTLTGLTPNTTYNYQVISANSAGGSSTSINYQFATLSVSAKPPTLGYVAFWGITNNSVIISWSTDVNTNTVLAYGTSPSLGQIYTDTDPSETSTANHGVVLTGLLPSTTYYFVAQSTAQSGATGYSAIFSFTTTGTASTAPSFTLSATNVTAAVGSAGASTVIVAPTNGFNSAVTLATSGWPSGITATFATNPISTSSSVTINVDGSVAPGSYLLTVNGTSGTLSMSATISLTVSGQNVFTLSATPATAKVGSTGNYMAYGDSITYGAGASSFATDYASLIAADVSSTLTNRGVKSSQACDAAQVIMANDDPPESMAPLQTIMIGINDAYYNGVGPYESVYKSCHTASLAWLVVPSTQKTLAQSCTQTGTWTPDTTYLSGVALESSTNGSVLSCPLTSYGGPLYLWYRVTDSNAGMFAYAIDGGQPTQIKSFSSPPIQTAEGGVDGVFMVRVAGLAAGPHTVQMVVTSPTSSSNVVSILAVGSLNTLAKYGAPQLFVGGVIRFQDDAFPDASAAYDADAVADVALLSGDGAPVYFAPVRDYVDPFTNMYDGFHPNDSGHSELRNAFEAVPQFSVYTSGSVTSIVTVTPANGFNSAVTLAASDWPDGITATFGADPVTFSSIVTIQVGAGVAPGLYLLAVNGSSGSFSASTTIPLTVNEGLTPGFVLSATSATVSKGTTGTSTVTIAPESGFNSGVTLAPSGWPTGITGTFGTNPATASSSVAISVDAGVAAGAYTLTVNGTGGTWTGSTTIALTVTAPPSFTLSASPAAAVAGASGTSTVTVAPANGFNSPVALVTSNWPTGIAAAFGTNPATGSSTATISIDAGVATGSYSLTVSGTSGALSASTAIALTVSTSQTITFGSIATQTYGVPLTLAATASSGLAVNYASTTTSVCTVSGTTATFVAGGTCTIAASQAGNVTYVAATPVTQSFTVDGPQTITFGTIAAQTPGTMLTLTATASSGLAVSYASTTASVCTVSGATATFLTGGTCSITASQAGNAEYSATTGTQSFTVLSTQTITFGTIAAQAVGTPLTLTAAASSGLAVSYSSATPSVCTASGSTVTFLAGGMCSITASQAGNSSYAAAIPVPQDFTVVATGPAPYVGYVVAWGINNTGATVTWSTDVPATTQLAYGMTTALGQLSPLQTTLTASHGVTLSNLTPGTMYYFVAQSTGADGVTGSSSVMSFATTGTAPENPAPVISGVASGSITNTTAIITWNTDEASSSQVDYGATTAYGMASTLNTSLVTSHSIALTGLTPGTAYDYDVLSTNATGQLSTSGNFTFTTTGSAPAPVISNVTTSGLTSSSVTITWTTDQASSSMTNYGTTTAYGSSSTLSTNMVTSHSVTLSGLTPGATYDFDVISANATNVSAMSGNATFTTPVSMGPAPNVGYVAAWGINNTGATVTWSTDVQANTQLAYGTTPSLGSLSPLQTTLTASHGVTLSNLTAGTTYYFVAQSTGADGVTGYSAVMSFTTTGTAPANPAPVISSVASGSITNTLALITWNTDEASSSQVNYGATTAYGLSSTLNPTLVTGHSVSLTGLTPGTTYNFDVVSMNATSQSSTSGNFTFTTTGSAPAPVITNVATSSLTGNSVTISWTTDQASISLVNYGTSTGYGSSTSNSSLVTSHSVTLMGLTPGTTYDFDVVSANAGNVSTTSANAAFTTPTATGHPPNVGYVAFWGINNTAVTISWSTDVPATTQLTYGTTTAMGSLTPVQTALTASHGVVLTGLSPGTTYYFEAQSTSTGGVTGSSTQYSFTTTVSP